MSLKGPIVLIDDDDDDQYLVQSMLQELDLPNELRLFENGKHALDYLKNTAESPFLILCDINMPVMNGLELRDQIDADPYLKDKSIPFVFQSTSADFFLIKECYKGNIQGFFKKEMDMKSCIDQLDLIIRYWQVSLHPNK